MSYHPSADLQMGNLDNEQDNYEKDHTQSMSYGTTEGS